MADIDVGTLAGYITLDTTGVAQGVQAATSDVTRFADVARTQGQSAGQGLTTAFVAALSGMTSQVAQQGTQAGQALGTSAGNAASTGLASGIEQGIQQGTSSGQAAASALGSDLGNGAQQGVSQGVQQGAAQGAAAAASSGGALGSSLGSAAQSGVADGIQTGASQGAAAAAGNGGPLGTNLGNAAQAGVAGGIAQGAQQGAAAGASAGAHLGQNTGHAAAPYVTSGIVQGAQAGAAQGADAGKELGTKFSDLMKAGIAAAGIGAILSAAMDIEDQGHKFEVVLSETAEGAKKYSADAAKVFKDNWAESTDEAADHIMSVVNSIKGMKTATDTVVVSTVEQISALSGAFGEEFEKIATGAGKLVSTGLAGSVTEALDVITRGLQLTNGKADDLLDTFNEYPVQFKKLGIDAATAMGLISQAVNGGARDTDIAADAFKEFSLRVMTVSEASTTAFQQLGLNAEGMYKKFAAGGTVAKNGVQEVLTAISKVEDPTTRAAAATALFGTQFEDLGTAFNLLNVDTAVQGLGDVDGAAQKAADTMGTSASNTIAAFWKQLQTVGQTIGTDVLPVVMPVLGVIGDLTGVVGDAIGVWSGLPTPIKNASLALGAMLLIRGPMNAMLQGVAQGLGNLTIKLAAMLSSSASSSIARFAGGISSLGKFMAGPWGLAVAMGVSALIPWMSGNEDAAKAVADHQAAITDLEGTVNQITGALTAASAVKIGKDWVDKGVADQFKGIGAGAGEAAAAIVAGGPAIDTYRQKIIKLAGGIDGVAAAAHLNSNEFNVYKDLAKRAGVSTQEMAAALLKGGDAQAAMTKKVQDGTRAAGYNQFTIDGTAQSLDMLKTKLGQGTPALGTFNDEVFTSGQASQLAAKQFTTLATSAATMAKVDPTKLVSALQEVGATGGDVESKLKSLGLSTSTINTVIGALGNATQRGASGLHYMTSEAAAADAGLAIQTASAKEAAAAEKALADNTYEAKTGFGKFNESAQDHARMLNQIGTVTGDVATKQNGLVGVSDDVAAAFEGMSVSAYKAKQAQQESTDPTLSLTQALKEESQAASAVSDQISYMLLQLDKAAGRNVDAEAAARANAGAIRDSGKAVRDYNDAVAAADKVDKDSKSTLAEKADAADKVADALDGMAEANDRVTATAAEQVTSSINQGIAQGNLNKGIAAGVQKMTDIRAAFIAAQSPADIASGKAAKLADSYGLIPKNVKTSFQAEMEAAQANGQSLVRTYDKAKGTWSAQFMTAGQAKALQDTGTTVQKYDTAKGTWTANFDAYTDTAQKKVDAFKAGAGAAGTTVPIDGDTSGAKSEINALNGSVVKITIRSDGSFRTPSGVVGMAAGGDVVGGIPGQDSVPTLLMPDEWVTTTKDRKRGANAAALQFMHSGGTFKNPQKMAAGGPVNRTSAAKLSGKAAAQYGAVASIVIGGLDEFYQGIADIKQNLTDLKANVVGMTQALKDAKSNQSQVNKDQASRLRDSRSNLTTANTARDKARKAQQSADSKLATAEATHNAKKIADAKKVVAAADRQAASTKKSADAAQKSYNATLKSANAINAEAAAKVKAANTSLRSANSAAAVAQKQATAIDRNRASTSKLVQEQNKLANGLDRMNDKLANDKAQLAATKDNKAQLASSISGTIAGFEGGITGFSDQRTTPQDYINGLKRNKDQVTKERQNLDRLKALGLRSDLLSQIAGDSNGAQIAASLAGSTKGQISQINSLQAGTLAQAGAAGLSVAGAAFDKLIASQQASVNSDTKVVGAITKAMSNIGGVVEAGIAAGYRGIIFKLDPAGMARLVNAGNAALKGR